MSELNPYARFLDGRPVVTILRSTVAEVEKLLAEMGPEVVQTPPAPGKWSAAEIVCHLADCELVFGFRLRQTLAEEGPSIQPFDQDKWAKGYGSIPAATAWEVFAKLRAWNLLLIDQTMPAAAERTMTHPERGTMTFLQVLETIAGHDRNHLEQLQRLAHG